MTQVSTSGRSTPKKAGGSWCSFTMPMGTSMSPARSEKGPRGAHSTTACSTSAEPPRPAPDTASSHSSSA